MRRTDERNYQTTWEDLQAWIDQLYEDHRVVVEFHVMLSPAAYGVEPAVVMTAKRFDWPRQTREVKRDWKPIRRRSVGMVERECLQMVSLFLLELDNDAARAEQQQTLFLAP